MRKLLHKLVVVTLLAITPATLLAEEDKWYTVEVISFTRNASDNSAERWSELPYREEASAGLYSLDDLQSVPKEDWQLGPHAYSINRAAEMTLASHQAWRQKGLSRNQSPWIPLNAGDGSLKGKIKISLSRYLHADVEINLDNPDRFSGNGLMTSGEVRFIASKKITRDKLHYIDHPLAGVLVLIERYQPET